MPPSNRDIFDSLLASRQLDLIRGDIFETAPRPLPAGSSWDKVEGMLLGIAVGDALGLPTEGFRRWQHRSRYPIPLDYLPGRNGPSDDSEMSFRTVEAMLHDGGFNPEHVAHIFAEEHIHGSGGLVRKFRENARNGGSWWEWAAREPEPLGDGAIMRVAPVVLPYLRAPSADLWIDAALCGRITHDSSVSTAACVALVNLIWQCLGMTAPPAPEWWADEFLRVFLPLSSRPVCPPYDHVRPLFIGFEGQLCDFVNEHVKRAFAEGRSVRDMCSPEGDGWGSGPMLFETLPSLLFVLMKHGGSFEEVVTVSVLDTRDNDTIASIIGAVLGALHGKECIPGRWITGLSGRSRRDDDGQVFRLIQQAQHTFWGGAAA